MLTARPSRSYTSSVMVSVSGSYSRYSSKVNSTPWVSSSWPEETELSELAALYAALSWLVTAWASYSERGTRVKAP